MRQETGVPGNKPFHKLKNGALPGDVAQLLHLPSLRESLGSTLGMAYICCDGMRTSPQHMGDREKRMAILSLAMW